ncbi:hypothetical protein A3Q56_07992 [Intoshia linei]|uniref:Uncharacterized protein n=1 Tax=Intoshia linei TaxID=1819745 RepID=A0A177AQN3_9BILA|nr:hypothetical protein A3Q56_07992 [Intoshia linei]
MEEKNMENEKFDINHCSVNLHKAIQTISQCKKPNVESPANVDAAKMFRNDYEKFKQIAIYQDGRICLSILHAPGDDPSGYESKNER